LRHDHTSSPVTIENDQLVFGKCLNVQYCELIGLFACGYIKAAKHDEAWVVKEEGMLLFIGAVACVQNEQKRVAIQLIMNPHDLMRALRDMALWIVVPSIAAN